MKRKRNSFFDKNFMDDLDPDLKELFAEETMLLKNKSKKKKKTAMFKIGDSVEAHNDYGTVIFGPYLDAFNNDVYEIETEAGNIMTVAENQMKEYVAPVETNNDDDDLL